MKISNGYYFVGVLIILVLIIVAIEGCNKCTTEFKRSYENVLSRKKRYLVYPAGSNLLMTGSLVKAIVIARPTGYNLFYEQDIFFPLPNTWRLPKNKPSVKPIPSQSTPIEPPPLFVTDLEHFHHDHPGEIFVPPGGWENNIFDNLQSSPPVAMAKEKYWDENLRVPQYSDYNPFAKYNQKYPTSSKYNDYNYNRIPAKTIIDPGQSYYNNKWNRNSQSNGNQNYPQKPWLGQAQGGYSPYNYNMRGRGRSLNLDNEGNHKNESAPNDNLHEHDDEDWEHNYGHRDRRDLYSILEKSINITGFSTKDCILRTMCEVRHFLMPPGKSLLQDMFRILFTLPTRTHMKDDYSNAMRSEEEDCDTVYGVNCPMSFLEFVLNNK